MCVVVCVWGCVCVCVCVGVCVFVCVCVCVCVTTTHSGLSHHERVSKVLPKSKKSLEPSKLLYRVVEKVFRGKKLFPLKKPKIKLWPSELCVTQWKQNVPDYYALEFHHSGMFFASLVGPRSKSHLNFFTE